jgi:hypothetical protein
VRDEAAASVSRAARRVSWRRCGPRGRPVFGVDIRCLIALRESVLQIGVPELVDSTRLSQHLPVQCAFKERHELHPSSLRPKGYFCEQQ